MYLGLVGASEITCCGNCIVEITSVQVSEYSDSVFMGCQRIVALQK